MGFKDSDFLKWHDGMFEMEANLIARQKAAGNNMDDPDYGVWNRYVMVLRDNAEASRIHGGDIHASVQEKQVAFLKATGVKV